MLVRITRKKAGRIESPTYGVIDSQSAKTVAASEERGFDGGKKGKGRKRHIVVDVLGSLLAVVVHAANIHDTKSGIHSARKALRRYPTIKKFCGDEGYRKSFEKDVKMQLGLGVDISARIAPEFVVVPKRWVVERTLAWLSNSRWLAKDYEITTTSEVAWVMFSHSRVLLRTLASE